MGQQDDDEETFQTHTREDDYRLQLKELWQTEGGPTRGRGRGLEFPLTQVTREHKGQKPPTERHQGATAQVITQENGHHVLAFSHR